MPGLGTPKPAEDGGRPTSCQNPGAILPRSAVTTMPFVARNSIANRLTSDVIEMADYYPLISSAVARLDADAPRQTRRALYERARAAQLTQLRACSPPLSEAEIMCERLALEEAVSKVEAEAAQRARDISVPTLTDLGTVADDMGKAAVRAKRRSSLPDEESMEVVPSMVLAGGATGRLVAFWRWRSLPPRRIDGR
jgi:hypothetical protein